jgi:hypothetical protein
MSINLLCYNRVVVSSSMVISITRSISFHRLYHAAKITGLFQEWNKTLPHIRPCYSVSRRTSPEVISALREHRIQMICHNARELKMVNDDTLVVMDNGKRTAYNEYIARSIKTFDMPKSATIVGHGYPSLLPVWIHTTISNSGIEQTRKMYERVWADTRILNGIVFDISNFTHPLQSIPPSLYSYKVAIDYILRNMVDPFEKEYGIITPAIMMDGRNTIIQMRNLYDLNEIALSSVQYRGRGRRPELHLIVDSLIDDLA